VECGPTGVDLSKILGGQTKILGAKGDKVINAWAFLKYWGSRARAAPPKSTPMCGPIQFMSNQRTQSKSISQDKSGICKMDSTVHRIVSSKYWKTKILYIQTELQSIWH